jgi:magnesium-transporting ATPase (P-type)
MSEKTRELAESHVTGQANKPMSRPAHALSSTQVVQELGADAVTGLSQGAATSRLHEYGPNDLGKEKGVNFMEILIAQVVNSMTLVSRYRRRRFRVTTQPSYHGLYI